MIAISVLRAMAAAGASQEMIFAAIEADQKIENEAAADKREGNRIRKRNQRARHAESRDIAGQRVTSVTTPSSPSPPSSSPLTLSLITTPSSSPSPSASLRSAATSDDWPDDFADQFWRKWPNKVAKVPGMKALAKARRRVPFGVMMAALERFVQSTDPQFYGHPASWLNADRWTDEPQPRNTNGKRTVQQAATDLVERVRAFDAPAPDQLRVGTGAADVRMLSEGRRQ